MKFLTITLMQFGHSVMHLHADAGGLTDAQHRESLELFQSHIAPVLRRGITDPPWPWPGTSDSVASPVPAGTRTLGPPCPLRR
jgi:hypothetical protein